MGVLFNPEFQGHVIRRKAVEAAAAARGINLLPGGPGWPTIWTRHSSRWRANKLTA